MEIYLIRHADAVPFSEFPGVDEDRPLTDKGEQECQRLREWFTSRKISIAGMVTSPLVRAVETAALIAPLIGIASEAMFQNESLAPGGKFKRLAKLLKDLKLESVALVGHMPDLGELTGWLIGSRRVEINFAKSGVALVKTDSVKIEKGCGELLWMLNPEWLGSGV